jgi:hypothetical protein
VLFVTLGPLPSPLIGESKSQEASSTVRTIFFRPYPSLWSLIFCTTD